MSSQDAKNTSNREKERERERDICSLGDECGKSRLVAAGGKAGGCCTDPLPLARLGIQLCMSRRVFVRVSVHNGLPASYRSSGSILSSRIGRGLMAGTPTATSSETGGCRVEVHFFMYALPLGVR